MGSEGDVTRILEELRAGKTGAPAELLEVLYQELHRLAGAAMKKERTGHTLQPTALVNEVYLRLMADEETEWRNRAHFFGSASQAMRRVLVDYARGHDAQKRGGGKQRVTISGQELASSSTDALDVIAVDEALTELARQDERKSRLVELRFFGGLGFAEAAEVLGVSEITAKRDWSYAKAWLYRRIAGEKRTEP